MAGPIRLTVLANAAQAKAEFNSVSGAAGSLGGKMQSFAKKWGAGMLVAGAAVAKFGADSVKAASDAQQSLGATETIFGKYADTVIRRSNEAARAIGISANEYRELSNVVGASLSAAGMPLKRVTSLTDQLNTRAADLAATFGGTTRESIEAISSLLRGEADPIERYGGSIKQSDVNARLAAQGLDKLTGSAKKQAEQQARVELLFKQTSKSAGAFKRESGTLAHQQQVLGAQFTDLKAKLGTVLLPVLTRVFAFVNDTVIPAAEKLGKQIGSALGPAVERVKSGFSDLAGRLAPVGKWFSDHPELIKGAGIALGIAAAAASVFAVAMGAVALASSPITLVVLAIAAVGAGIAYAYKNSETFRNAVQALGTKLQEAFRAVLPVIQQVAAWLVTKWQEIQPTVLSVFQSIGQIVTSAMSIISSVISGAVTVITGLWNRFGAGILAYLSGALNSVVTVVKGVFQVLSGIFQTVASVLKGDWKGAWDGIKKIAQGAVNILKGLLSGAWNTIKFAASSAWNALKGIVSAAWEGVKSAVKTGVRAAIDLVKSLPGKILNAIGDLGSLLLDAGKKLIQGLIDGIGAMVGKVKDTLTDLTNKLTSWKGPPKKDKRLLRKSGRLIIQGLIDGFADGTPSVEKFLGALTDNIRATLDKRFDGKKLKKKTAALVKSLKTEFKALAANAAQQDAVTAALNDARAAYDGLVQASAAYAENIRAGVTATGDLTKIASTLGGRLSASNIITALQGKVAAAQDYAARIATLTRWGLNKTAIQQLIDAGVEGGLATAQALVDGGARAISEINNLQDQLNTTGVALGASTASTMYDAGLQAAKGLIAGLESQSAAIAAAAANIAATLTKKTKKKLKVKSPSRVFREIGASVTDGLVIGLNPDRVGAMGERMAVRLQDGFSRPALEAFAGGGASSAPVPVEITITSDGLDQLSRGRAIRADLNAWDSVGGRAIAS